MTNNYATQPPLTYVKPNFLTTVSSTPLQLTGAGTQLIVNSNASLGSVNVYGVATVGALTVSGQTVVTTAPLNDSSATIASTAFVMRAVQAATASSAMNGGTLTNTVLTNLIANIATFTGSGDVTLAANQFVLLINKSSPASTTVNLPSNAIVGQIYTIKDRAGNCGSYPITISPAVGKIDGASTTVLNNNYASIDLIWDSVAWSIL